MGLPRNSLQLPAIFAIACDKKLHVRRQRDERTNDILDAARKYEPGSGEEKDVAHLFPEPTFELCGIVFGNNSGELRNINCIRNYLELSSETDLAREVLDEVRYRLYDVRFQVDAFVDRPH